MQVQLLSENAQIPQRQSSGAAGYDLFSAYDMIIKPCDKAIVKTDIAIQVPHGTYGRVAPRSDALLGNYIATDFISKYPDMIYKFICICPVGMFPIISSYNNYFLLLFAIGFPYIFASLLL